MAVNMTEIKKTAKTNRPGIVPVPLKNVRIEDGFWKPRIETVRRVMLPFQWEALNDRVPGVAKSGAVHNFRVAAGLEQGSFIGFPWQDSDLAKWIEAVGYSLATRPDPALEATTDELIETIARAQDADGYLNTAFTVKDRDKRWSNLADCHELYVAGHMIEAAVTYYEGTGKRKLLDVMIRNAQHIARRFGLGEGQRRGWCGHPEIELALMRLYRATGDPEFARLATYFITDRGTEPNVFAEEHRLAGRDPKTMFSTYGGPIQVLAHKPLREHDTVEGHAVRAVYLYSGATDVATETGDAALRKVCRKVWDNLVLRRMYVTGGIGSSAHGEMFTSDYDLPNETAYAETCAAIGLVFWAHRMLNAEADSRYADVMERALYNGVLVGASRDGRKFFYANRLAIPPGMAKPGGDNLSTQRLGWFGCACCPPNYARMLTSLGKYVYGVAGDTLFTHLYIGGRATACFGGVNVTVTQKTDYPWDGAVTLAVKPAKPATFTLALRIPGWCRRAELLVDGKRVALGPLMNKGYAQVRRTWTGTECVALRMEMPVARVTAHPRVRQDVGRVALQRGPVVYCLEEADNGPLLDDIELPAGARLTVSKERKLFGTPVLTGTARRLRHDDWKGTLYRGAEAKSDKARIVAVPYHLWAHRKAGEMRVWLRSGA